MREENQVGKSVYEHVYQHKYPNTRDAMNEAMKRAMEQIEKLEREHPGTKHIYDEIWDMVSGELAEKFIRVKAMVEDQEWFTKHAKYIDADFFKDKFVDTLAEIVVFMKNSLMKGLPVNMASVRRFINELTPSHFPVSSYAEDYRKEILGCFNKLEDLPEKMMRDAKADVLMLCLQRNTLRRTLSDPDVYIALGYDVRNKMELDKLMHDGEAMKVALDKFEEERELVKDIRNYLMTLDNTNPADA